MPLRHFYPQSMTVQLTADQESKLSRMAAQTGRAVDDLTREAVDIYIAEEQRFQAGVNKGQQAASEGKFLSKSEVWAKVEAALNA